MNKFKDEQATPLAHSLGVFAVDWGGAERYERCARMLLLASAMYLSAADVRALKTPEIDTWVTVVPSRLLAVYSQLAPHARLKSEPTRGLLVEYANDPAKCESTLSVFGGTSKQGPGYVVRVEGGRLHSQFGERCTARLAYILKATTWQACSEQSGVQFPVATYFIASASSRPVCLYPLEQAEISLAARRIEFAPAYPSGTPKHLSDAQALSSTFASAPVWQDVLDGRQRNRACIAHATGVAAHEVKTVESGAAPVQTLLWQHQYLVRLRTRLICGDADYRVDIANRPVGSLPDGSVLVAGARSVVRIRAADGTTEASPLVVRRVTMGSYIDKLRNDGGSDCLHEESWACKWVKLGGGQQRSNDQSDDPYGKYWLQGFNRAIEQLFFEGEEK